MPRVASDAAAHIGARIGDERRRLALTQDQLAVASGIDSSNVRAYESGRSMLSVHSLVRIADALGVEPGSLLDGLTLDMFGAGSSTARRPGGRA